MSEVGDPGMRGVLVRVLDGACVVIASTDAYAAGIACERTGFRLGKQPRHLTEPARKIRPDTHQAALERNPSPHERLDLVIERDQLIDRVARLQAEFENARKRAEREKADYREYATGNVIEQFLPVLDNFELALKAKGSAEQLRSGVELIVKQMEEALRGLNVVPVESVGTQFDPRIHEALGSIETKEFPDHQVLDDHVDRLPGGF